MKILAPVTSVYEAEELLAGGATELYCGLHPLVWEKHFGKEVWLNRRAGGFGNIADLASLQATVATAQKVNVPVYLTLNLPAYPAELYSALLELVKAVTEQCGVAGLIISDPGLIRAVKETLPKVSIHVSSLAAVLNSEAVELFRDLGVCRIIFPRYMDIGDMQQIMQACPNLEYEVFALNDGCIFEEGYCNASHALGGAFCHNPAWSYTWREHDAEFTAPRHESLPKHLEDYRWWQWVAIKNSGGIPGPTGLSSGMCGLCALPQFKAMGVTALKIVGREAPLAKKKASVKLLHTVGELINVGDPPEVVKIKAKSLRNKPELCHSGYMCYYR
ncbi:MAG: U32 family peptidase [Peptococcaceae bacterium]|nr:U32 family peptidase [Peptococcaceae bacterium]